MHGCEAGAKEGGEKYGKLEGVTRVGEAVTPANELCQNTTPGEEVVILRTDTTRDVSGGPDQSPAHLTSVPCTDNSLGGVAGGETSWVQALERVSSTRLSPDHPCLKLLQRRGMDLGVPQDFERFTVNPSPLEGKRWYVSVTVKGRSAEFLIDTGASHSMVSKRFYDLMSDGQDNLISRVNAHSADGSRMQTFGRTFVQVSIAGNEFIFSPTIADLSDDGIIGLDFAALYGAVLEPCKGMLSIEHPYKLAVQCVLRKVSSVAAVVQTVKIPPGQTCDVLFSSDASFRDQTAVVEPDMVLLAAVGLESADTFVGSGSRNVIPISNPGREVKYLEKGTAVGQVSVAQANTGMLSEDNSPDHKGPSELRPELRKLVDDSNLVSVEQKERLEQLLRQYDIAFGEPTGLGRTDLVYHTINTADSKPFKIPYRRLPLKKKLMAEKEIADQLRLGVIVPSTSPWSSPVQMVTKKDGTIRFCIDYRKLNGCTKKNSYPLPRIDETIDSLGGNQWFCTLDLQSGYWQVGMKEEDQEKTAFSSHVGLFQYNVMPFGLCNAPATFEAMMESLLSDMLWKECLVYLDDVIVFGKTFESCLASLAKIFERLRRNGLKLKPKKCNLFRTSINYLGRIISTEGVKADPEKLESVSDWEKPEGPRDIRSFLGFCSYYRDFLPGYARVAQPLQALAHWTPGRRKEPFPWGSEQDLAFKAVKELFRTTPVLKYPTADGHFILDTDASNDSIGAALSQVQEGREVPLAFASNTLNKAQRNYCTTKRELLAVVVYTKKFKHFLWGGDFTLRTDHSSLRWLLNFKEAEGMIGRWLTHLSEFGLENSQIQHRAGTKHINADALSRKPVRKCSRNDCDDCGAHNAIVAGVRSPFDVGRSQAMQWSTETIKQFQKEDPVLSRLMDMVSRGIRPERPLLSLENREMRRLLAQWDELAVFDNLLCRWKITPNRPKVRQIVIPTAMRRDIMFFVHGHMTSGHFGKKRSLARLSRRYYWPGMGTDLIRWISTCPDCCLSKPGEGLGKSPLSQELWGVRFARVAVDIISGLRTTPNGNTCMMVVSDYYSKYTRVFPLKDHKAHTCAAAFVKGWVLHLGVPLMLHSDQGREFESELWSEMCHSLAICKTRTNPYRPQSDGQVERFNRTLIQVLKPLVNNEMDDWDEQCEFVVHAYNSTVHASTGCSPNLLVFGEDLIMPADLVFGVAGIDTTIPCQVMFVEALRDQFKSAYEMVRNELEKSASWQKLGYDVNLKPRFFRVGDEVLRLHDPLQQLKLSPNWDGPFTVVRIVSESTVVIKSKIGRLYKSNVARLRMWRGDEEAHSNALDDPDGGKPPHLATTGAKKGPGRPRKNGGGRPPVKGKSSNPNSKSQKKNKGGRPKKFSADKDIRKKVSTNEGLKGRRAAQVTTGQSSKTRGKTGSKAEPLVGVRRSSRIAERTAVT